MIVITFIVGVFTFLKSRDLWVSWQGLALGADLELAGVSEVQIPQISKYFFNSECLSCVCKISMPSWSRSSVRQMVLKPSIFESSVYVLQSLEF